MIARLLRLFGREEESAGMTPDVTGLLQVTSDATRCVQCGICGYNCPVGIEVREYARRGEHVTDSRCIHCGACIEKCPRGTLKWGAAILVRADDTLQVDPDALPTMLQLQPRDQGEWKST
jgi:Pyruvate/2-oxoacid:ferredoxin oxidoreductase delta subunit